MCTLEMFVVISHFTENFAEIKTKISVNCCDVYSLHNNFSIRLGFLFQISLTGLGCQPVR